MKQTHSKPIYRLTPQSLHVDFILFGLILVAIIYGLIILYSASNENTGMLLRQGVRLGCALLIMLLFSMVPPHKYKIWTPSIYFFGLFLLIIVMLIGKIGKGAQRWLDLGLFHFQPSEIMKLAVPMMTSWYFSNQINTQLRAKNLLIAFMIILIPAVIIAKQPDLGTAIMVISSGFCVVFLAGISLRFIVSLLTLAGVSLPFLWHFLYDYQKQRIYTLLNPEADPLGKGYHIIQSKIAIGSGGTYGKGWLLGSQSHLNFLPEHATDFIFAVGSEEFGFIGSCIIILLMMLISWRGLIIAKNAQTTYTQLLAASLVATFFLSAFVNMAMVMGILPVVGIPLPLISYGGTAMVTFLAGFGIIMSISSHRILFNAVR